MGYDLTALIAPARVPLAASLPEARTVPLEQRMFLVPLTDDVIDAITGGAAERVDGFRALTEVLAERAVRASAAGPIAYVEADIFGGTGSQDVRVWRDGAVVLDRHDPDGRLPWSPISEAMHLLGVRAAQGDEFQAAGLGRHRRTEDWLDEPST